MRFNHVQIQRRLRQSGLSGGFSLIEIAFAIGIISFGLIAIIGLLPVALESARDSRTETRAGHIFQSVYSDLMTRGGILAGPDPGADFLTGATVFPSAGGSRTTYVYYLQDADLNAPGSNSPLILSPGSRSRAYFKVAITLTANPAMLPTGYQVDVTVGWPVLPGESDSDPSINQVSATGLLSQEAAQRGAIGVSP